MSFIKPCESREVLESQIGEIEFVDDAIEQFLIFFREHKTKEKLDDEEDDMMLCQYGNYDWGNEHGEEFSFDLTRQFAIPGEEEYLQLSLTLFYEVEQIGKIKEYGSWSVDSKDLNEWESQIKETNGYKKIKQLKPKRVTIELNGT